jgi:molybdopterin-binding protein
MVMPQGYCSRDSEYTFAPVLNPEGVGMALSARNQFKGKVISLKGGSVMTEVVIDIGGGHQVVALISTSSAKRLKLRKGGDAVAIIKATEVIVSNETGEG